MKHRKSLRLICYLTAVAGWTDAIGFLLVSHVFVSFMSGNSTQLMIAISHFNYPEIIIMLEIITSFIMGVSIGELTSHKTGDKHTFVIFCFESLLLWITVALIALDIPPIYFLPLLAFAMGMHNTAIKEGDTLLIKTYISGTLVSLGLSIGKALAKKQTARKILSPLAVYFSFVLGALSGAFIAVYVSLTLSLSLLALMLSIAALKHL